MTAYLLVGGPGHGTWVEGLFRFRETVDGHTYSKRGVAFVGVWYAFVPPEPAADEIRTLLEKGPPTGLDLRCITPNGSTIRHGELVKCVDGKTVCGFCGKEPGG